MSEERAKKNLPYCLNGVIYRADHAVAVWVQSRLGGDLVATLGYVALGVVHPHFTDEQANKMLDDAAVPNLQSLLAAGAVFFNELSGSGALGGEVSDIMVSVAVDNLETAHPRVFREVLQYPFGERKLRRITAEIESNNQRCIAQAEKLGFKLEGRKREGGPGGSDVLIYGLLPRECPFWKEPVEVAA